MGSGMKKTATGRQIAIVVLRAMPAWSRGTPEGNLWYAVIAQALAESGRRIEARRFLDGEVCELICSAIGLNFDYLQELLRDHAEWRPTA